MSTRYQYEIAGVDLVTDRALPLPPGRAGGGRSVTVRFRLPRQPKDWQSLPRTVAGDTRLWVSLDGRRVRIIAEDGQAERLLAIRRAVPFAAALQGLVLLHASAIVDRGLAVGFCGPGGVGKSTLAAACDRPLLADDLLGLFKHEQGLVAVPEGPAGPGSQFPLGLLFFLEPRSIAGAPSIQRLLPKQLLLRLLRHGFGEAPLARIWKAQFNLYVDVCANVPAAAVSLPDELGLIQSSARELLAYARRSAPGHPVA